MGVKRSYPISYIVEGTFSFVENILCLRFAE